jgi:muconolactone delta-isomerase
MRYLVTAKRMESGPMVPPQQAAMIIRTAVLPTLEALAKMESEGKIRGGVVAGARDAAYVLEADSHDEATQILMGLPAWAFSQVELTPLQSFETRVEQTRQVLERLEAVAQQA